MLLLRFHPKETQKLSTILSNETPPYVTFGYERHNDVLYNVSTYSFYYENNISIGCGHTCFPLLKCLGYHPHDIEYVSIYAIAGVNKKVFFSAHSPNQGTWCSWEECEKTTDGRLIVYVALNSHACYPHAGRYWRVFGLANDVCSDKGNTFIVSTLTRSYDFCFPNGVRLYKGLRPAPPDVCLKPWQRFLLQLSNSYHC